MRLLRKIDTKLLAFLVIFVSVNLIFFIIGHKKIEYFVFSQLINTQNIFEDQNRKEVSKEIQAILSTNDLDQQAKLYTKLIKRIGPEPAQEVLYQSGIPFDGQSHLLNHTVGDFLYDSIGDSGLAECKDYFLSSCYHGFLIKFIAKNGIERLNDVMNECWESGYATAIQCGHGIGHGLLAYVGYKNLPDALILCDKVAEISKDFPLYNCHDGVFMENNWAIHEDGTPSDDRWINLDDPVYPCNDQQILEKYRKACWSNQPQMMFKDIFHGDIRKVSSECLKLPEGEYQFTCFDSLARQIHPLTKNSVNETFRLCNLVSSEWIDECIYSISRAYFSVGDKTLPFTICESLKTAKQPSCFQSLSSVIKPYHPNIVERKRLCDKIPFRPVWENCMSV